MTPRMDALFVRGDGGGGSHMAQWFGARTALGAPCEVLTQAWHRTMLSQASFVNIVSPH